MTVDWQCAVIPIINTAMTDMIFNLIFISYYITAAKIRNKASL